MIRKKLHLALFTSAILIPGLSHAEVDCDVYAEDIEVCAAARGCETTIDDFADCLVEEQGIEELAADGTNEVEEVVHCFKTEYTCD